MRTTRKQETERRQAPVVLLCNMRENPIGVDAGKLHFSWRLEGERLCRQCAFQILVSASLADLQENRGTVWDSGRVDSAAMTHVPYEGAALLSQTYYYWKVRVWGEDGEATAYSEPAFFVTGVNGEWDAQWIWINETKPNSHVYVRKEIPLRAKQVKSVIMFASADDMYKLYVNGTFVGQGPCPSYPDIEHNYIGYELLPFCTPGQPLCIAVHAYYLGLASYTFVSNDGLAGWIAQIRIVYEDGTVDRIGTDETWKVYRSSTYASSRKFGYDTGFDEWIDARNEPEGWKEVGYSDDDWEQGGVQTGEWKLHAQETEGVHLEEMEPDHMVETGDGLRFDMGQEIVGMVRLTITGCAGDRVRIRLGEEREEDGSVRFELRCNCVYEDIWTLRSGEQTIEYYDYRAFRYGEVTVLSDSAHVESIRAIRRHYPFDGQAASFHSSDADLNALWDIAAYTTKVGTQELYMDCPSREKANYSLDTYLEMSAAYYVAGEWLLSRKMIDYFLQSDPTGKLHCVAPAGRPHHFTEYTMYPVLMAWRYYQYTGDKPFLVERYESFCRVYRYMTTFIDDSGLLARTNDTLTDLVDWPVQMRDEHEMLPINVVPNAVYGRMTAVMEMMARAVGRKDDAEAFANKAASFARTMNERFWNETSGAYCDGLDEEGRPSGHSSLHSNVFALAMGLVPEERTDAVIRYIKTRGMRCNLFLAKFLFEALFDYGAADYAIELLKADNEYSPMNMIRKGATTTWEVWDLPQKANASLCHPAGAFTAYVIGSRIMGVTPIEPGFAKVRICPQTAWLDSGTIRVPTIRGAIVVAFEREHESSYVLECEIPANTTADVWMPCPSWARQQPVGHRVLVNGAWQQGKIIGDRVILQDLPCGAYTIKVEAGDESV